MAKLDQLLTLERMFETYDNMEIHDASLTSNQAIAVSMLVDEIHTRINRLLQSKTRLSCRNVLVANFETMTDDNHWLKSRLFHDLPKQESMLLKEKIEDMVELMRQLFLKIMNVDPEYADNLIERLMKSYKKKRTTDYELWKGLQGEITLEMLTEYQAELTADMLIMGVLKYDRAAKGEEVDRVDIERLKKKLPRDKELPADFEGECAKLKRYSYWLGDMFFVDYKKLRKYIFRVLGKLTCEQIVAMYNYDAQLRMIHEDMARLDPELAKLLHGNALGDSLENTEYFAPYIGIYKMLSGDWLAEVRTDAKYNKVWAQKFADGLMRSDYRQQIVEDWKNRRYKIKGFILGYLKQAGVIDPKLTNRDIARAADIMDNPNTFGEYMGIESRKQPYAEWILNHIDDYC